MIDSPKTLAAARKYRYNRWGGNPDGNPFREGKCVEEVRETGRGGMAYQCQRKAVTGPANLFCKQHDPAAVVARAKASQDRYDARWSRSEKWNRINSLETAAELLRKEGLVSAANDCLSLMRKLKGEK